MRIFPGKPILLLTLILSLTNMASAQDAADDTKWTLRLDLMVPQPVSNKAFSLSFTGICDIGGSLNFRIGKMFNIGGQYRYKQFQVRPNKIPQSSVLQHTHNACLKLSFDRKTSKNTIFSPGVSIGYNWLNYTDVACTTMVATGKFANAINLEPHASFVWLVDEGFGMGLMVNYNLLAYEFNPDDICLSEKKSYTEKEKTGLTGSFSFGFSVFIDFAHQAEGFED